jgi:cell wall assembly regulator SMI1
MKKELVNRLNEFFGKNPTLVGKPANIEEIENAESKLGVKMDNDYKEFIQIFGGAYAGLAIHAFSNGSSIGNETVVELTKRSRELFNDSNVFPEINSCFVISDDGSGNPIAISENGEILLFDYDTEEKKVLSESFEKFIEDNFSEW